MPKRRPGLNTIYISERAQAFLRPMAACALTTVIAPRGSGKTTAVSWYLSARVREAGAVPVRISIYSDSLPMLWRSVQDAFSYAGLPFLEDYPCPEDPAGAGLLCELLCRTLSGRTQYNIFLDDCHLLPDARLGAFLAMLAGKLPENVHLIAASRDRILQDAEIVRLGGRLYRIGAEQLRLQPEELAIYAHRCGTDLTGGQVQALAQSSEGWFSAIYLNLCALYERGSLPDGESDIYEMFTAAMIAPLSPARQEFLAVMGLADEFTQEMARFVTENEDTPAILADLTERNAFVTRLPGGVSFRFHHMMKACAKRTFLALAPETQRRYWDRYGRWYSAHGQYLHALGAFDAAGNMDAALTVVEKDAGSLLSAYKPDELLRRLDACPPETLMRHPTAILVLMRRMFTWRQIPKMLELKALLASAIEADAAMPERERGNLRGECDLIMSFLMYNDITEMSRLHRSASRQMTRPAVTIRNSGSWTFGSPSVLMMYYRAPGELAGELQEMNECMPHYYRITNGHGMGAELVMAAEAHFMQGSFDEAQITLERARAAIETCPQENMTLCCDFLQLRLSLCIDGLPQYDMQSHRAALLQGREVALMPVFESICSYYAALCGAVSEIPEVFREHRLSEINIFAPGRPMVELIENQVYLAQGAYAKLIGRAQALLARCEAMHYALVALHVRIQMAASFLQLGNREQAAQLLSRALQDAEPDGFWLPFVENYRYLQPLLASGTCAAGPLAARICALGEAYEAKCRAVCLRPQRPEGLTEREWRIAQMLSQRRTNREIANELYLSEGTVKQYLNQMYAKLHIEGDTRSKRGKLIERLELSKKR